MTNSRFLFGFHAITVRLKTSPDSLIELYANMARKDQRMVGFLQKVQASNIKIIEADDDRLRQLSGGQRHQGVVARVHPKVQTQSLDDLLDEAAGPVLLLALDEVTDPHNLGACLRVADGAGVHAVIAPKDHAVGLNATVSKVACGAAETVPYFMVTNLARTLNELKDRGIWIIGTEGESTQSLYETDLSGPVALALGAEGKGLRQLTRKTCDVLIQIPMAGAVESLNVSVASGICLFEAVRQRGLTIPSVS